MNAVCLCAFFIADRCLKKTTTANVDTNNLYNFKIAAKFVIH